MTTRNINKLIRTVDGSSQIQIGHETFHNEKMQALQSTITKLEARLREADRLNKDNHRVELIKSLRMQLRESLTMNETLMNICGNHGIERHQIEPQLDAARARVKLVGIKKISEMRQEIELLRLQLKREQSKKSNRKSAEPTSRQYHINDEKESDPSLQLTMMNERLTMECEALKHRLAVTIDALQGLEQRFQILSNAHSQLNMSAGMQEALNVDDHLRSITAGDTSVDQDEIARIEQYWSKEVKRVKKREARVLVDQQELSNQLDQANTKIQSLAAHVSELDEQLAEKTTLLEALQDLFDDTKSKLKRLNKHLENNADDEAFKLENFRLKERITQLEKRCVNPGSSLSTQLSCQNCQAQAKRVDNLRAELKVARMINESIKDTSHQSSSTYECEMESMIALSVTYEKQIADLKDTIEKLTIQHKDVDSDSEFSLQDLEAEIDELSF